MHTSRADCRRWARAIATTITRRKCSPRLIVFLQCSLPYVYIMQCSLWVRTSGMNLQTVQAQNKKCWRLPTAVPRRLDTSGAAFRGQSAKVKLKRDNSNPVSPHFVPWSSHMCPLCLENSLCPAMLHLPDTVISHFKNVNLFRENVKINVYIFLVVR